MEHNLNQALTSQQVIAAVSSIDKQAWHAGYFEGTSPPLYYIRASTPGLGSDESGKLLQYVFERDVINGSLQNVSLHLINTGASQMAPQVLNGADITAALIELQEKLSTNIPTQSEAKLPSRSLDVQSAVLDDLDKQTNELVEAAAPLEIDDRALSRYSEIFVPLVRSMFGYDDQKAQPVLENLDFLRLGFALLMQDAAPNWSGLCKLMRETWPEFNAARLTGTCRGLLRLLHPTARCLNYNYNDHQLECNATVTSLHNQLKIRADFAILENLRRVVLGKERPRHGGAMSSVPVRVTEGQGGIVKLDSRRTLKLPAFAVSDVELPKTALQLYEAKELSPADYARYEGIVSQVSQATSTPYDLLRHLTPQEIERAGEEIELFQNLSEFDRLLKLGEFFGSMPYYSTLGLDDILRLELTNDEIGEFKSLLSLLSKAQDIEALLDPTPEMAASMRFWGIDAEKSQRRIKFDERLEKIVARIILYDGDGVSKNRMVRGNADYRFLTEPTHCGSAIVVETFLNSEVNSIRLNLLSTPTYQAVAEVVAHFDREIKPLTLEYNARFAEGAGVNRPVVKELISAIRFLRSLKNFYEGGGRASGVNYLTWRQVQVGQEVLASYGLRLSNFISLYKSGAEESESETFAIPALSEGY